MKKIIELIKISALSTLLFTAVLCVLYPLAVFTMGQLFFPYKANGSLVTHPVNNTIIGSALIGENFQGMQYFHPRPSAAGKTGYDASHSAPSNLGPTSQKLMTDLQTRVSTYRQINNVPSTIPIPADAVTSSGSGLDPHISVDNALMQLSRVAKARNMPESALKSLVTAHTKQPTFGFLGEPRVNVLLLNKALDGGKAKNQ